MDRAIRHALHLKLVYQYLKKGYGLEQVHHVFNNTLKNIIGCEELDLRSNFCKGIKIDYYFQK